MNPHQDQKYSVVWKYTIKPEHQSEFEKAYGVLGTWSNLFSKSKDYMGSFLHKSDEQAYTYLLIDTWKNADAYNEFMKSNKKEYNRLSAHFENLYEKEERIGAFNSLY